MTVLLLLLRWGEEAGEASVAGLSRRLSTSSGSLMPLEFRRRFASVSVARHLQQEGRAVVRCSANRSEGA